MAGYLDLDDVVLSRGAHARRVDGVSLLEAVAWWAGEPHSDHPACVSPALATFARAWADALDDDDRQRLKEWVPRLAGTAGDGGDRRRALLLADWLARTCAPMLLRLAGLAGAARRLEEAPPVAGWEHAVGIGAPLEAAHAAARAALATAWAGRDAASDAPQVADGAARLAGAPAAAAALDTALVRPGQGVDLTGALVRALVAEQAAAGPDVVAAALDDVCTLALHAARATAADVVSMAALAAALTAPPDAAWLVLRPHVRALQAGAVGLLDRLCAAGKVAV